MCRWRTVCQSPRIMYKSLGIAEAFFLFKGSLSPDLRLFTFRKIIRSPGFILNASDNSGMFIRTPLTRFHSGECSPNWAMAAISRGGCGLCRRANTRKKLWSGVKLLTLTPCLNCSFRLKASREIRTPPRSDIFSARVRVPLRRTPSVGENPLYSSISSFVRVLKLAASADVHQSDVVPVESK